MNKQSPLGGEARKSTNTSPEATAAIVTDKIAKRGLHAVQKSAVRLNSLVIEYVPTDSVKPNTYNPNRQDEATLTLLTRSITEDGFTQPVIVHRSSRQIVDGEHRWRVARKLNMTQIPVVFVDMTDEQMRIATLRHNRARGSEDIELSTEVLRDLQKLGAIEWAQDSLMISDSELNELLDEIPVAEALSGDEFQRAWSPERGDKAQTDVANNDQVSTKLVELPRPFGESGTNAFAMTKAAAAQVIDRKEKIEAASSELERGRISQSFEQPFRLHFVFTGDEADTVRDILGDEPAEKLLSICKEIVGSV
jgi:ParB/RepB/Spo0J family partition protein